MIKKVLYDAYKGVVKNLSGVLYPLRCPICDGVLTIGNDSGICSICEKEVEFVEEPYCKICGKPIESEVQELCENCQKESFSFEHGRAVFVYNYSMKNTIARFKYNGRCEYAEYFASQAVRIYGDWVKGISPDALIPVPIHKSRYRQRGYNQAQVIAESIGEKLGIRVVSDLIRRVKHTVPQKELSAAERRRNLYGAFEVIEEMKELYHELKCVIMIDDIYTTGSTIKACADILKDSGFDKVYFLCICIGKG